jgi:DNA mismatch repair protein MSH4
MSGKSTYIRSIAFISIMTQIGSFVPAVRAFVPIIHQLFARTCVDDSIEANVSTFAAEMREMAFILRNIDSRSLAIVDELGRGTSTRDGLAIAIAISETLIDSKALVWFATHFKDLAAILSERSGVVNLHMAVDMTPDQQSMSMLYRIAEGAVQDTHYGLALARVYPLPRSVLDTAAHVSHVLESHVRRQKKTSAAVLRERKRRLLLNLKEHLEQARSGSLGGEALRGWLAELQKEFVLRMVAIEREAGGDLRGERRGVDDGEGGQGDAGADGVDVDMVEVGSA